MNVLIFDPTVYGFAALRKVFDNLLSLMDCTSVSL